jgi:hypothetical protein
VLRDSTDQLTFFARLAANIDTAQARGQGPEEGANDTPVQP